MTLAEIGVDTGGTFTDIVCRLADGRIRIAKLPSTRSDPSRAVIAGIQDMLATLGLAPDRLGRVVHGTTVATNAIIERRGATLGLITTAGFRDVLAIGRQMRRQLYELELEPQTPVFLAPRDRRLEARERLAPTGEVLVPLHEVDVAAAADALVAQGVGAIAVVFLFSYVDGAHERRARDIIRQRHPGLQISISSEVDPTMREYERTAVTAFDAYLKPVVDGYLANLQTGLTRLGHRGPVQIMQSRGGISSLQAARAAPVRLVLSGPAAGVVGGRLVASQSSLDDIITVDIGGTSSDIALVSGGKPMLRPQGEIDGFPVRVPMVDVHAIGAGGGSIAWIDAAGGLRVGPRSAGAEPGPACYGRGGTAATVTDASLVLGWLNPDFFAGGQLALRRDLAVEAVRRTVAEPLGLGLEAAALGIHRVVNSQMAEGIRLVSIRQGFDPRDFTLVPVGGAGPLHGTALAAALGMRRILVPRYPGVMAATGLLAAAVEQEAVAAWMRELDQVDWAAMEAVLAALDRRCAEAIGHDGRVRVTRSADLCYAGQGDHLEVELPTGEDDPRAALRARFLALYRRVFGNLVEAPIRVLALRVVHSIEAGHALDLSGAVLDRPALRRRRSITLADGAAEEVPVFDRDALPAGFAFPGPAIIEQTDTTTLVEPGWHCTVQRTGALMLERP